MANKTIIRGFCTYMKKIKTGDEMTVKSNAPKFSQDALALEFIKRHGHHLRYVAPRRYWVHWNGTRWVEDSTMYVHQLARELCREASMEAFADPKTKLLARRLASVATVSAVIRMARCDSRVVVAQLDTELKPKKQTSLLGCA